MSKFIPQAHINKTKKTLEVDLLKLYFVCDGTMMVISWFFVKNLYGLFVEDASKL